MEIAAGERIGSDRLTGIAEPAALTCPACGGHGYTADALAKEQESQVDEALRVALRIIEERAELVHRMAEDGRNRLRNQQELLSELRIAGHDTTQEERPVGLLQDTLVEWQRHRTLIEQRVNIWNRSAIPKLSAIDDLPSSPESGARLEHAVELLLGASGRSRRAGCARSQAWPG